MLAIPLALQVAARIQERDAEDFVYDPTHLANALRDLTEAVDPDGVPVTAPEVLLVGCPDTARLLSSEQLDVALEATRRLRASAGDRIALVAELPGPAAIMDCCAAGPDAAADAVLALGRRFLAAGADVILIGDHAEPSGAGLSTLANVARFHQALALCHPVTRYGLAAATVVSLDTPGAGRGVTVTDRQLSRHTDIEVLRDWINAVRG
ncbi:hypothetical protein [Sphaerisporangium perillae]|uniref:hypothetical protein n=1 Tax=Sphaerisporangium perillae TaxID=2935860 RepID=UPI00200DDA65|nr:hypothetical protein [Sphaerisporangium perillae]